LLDGIHEDLNRVLVKQQTTQPEGYNRDDVELSEESWKLHLQRNNSIILDNFHGFLRNEIYCPECQNTNIIFEHFLNLCLPMPLEKNRLIHILLFKKNNIELPEKFILKVPKEGFFLFQ
jgi:ubiquitin C-terminal hydrolase